MRKYKDFIFDYTVYNIGLRKSLIDKIFFMDKVDATTFVDFGCADGALVTFLGRIFPEYAFIGFDNDINMIELANNTEHPSNVTFTPFWDIVIKHVNKKDSAVILSSVIHELYNSGHEDFMWSQVFDEFKYIIIRDILPSETINRRSLNFNIDSVKDYCYKNNHITYLDNFEKIWGSIEENRNLVHFLMKYRYIENWDKEVKENYFPINREDIVDLVPKNYEIIFFVNYTLPFLKNIVEKDFGIFIRDLTHFKMIIQKK